MTGVLALAAYAAAAGWLLPGPLARLTGSGVSVRLGAAAWLAALASVAASGGIALGVLVRTAWAAWPRLTLAVCREVAGNACTPTVYRGMLDALAAVALAAVAVLAAAVTAWRYGNRVRRSRRGTLDHGRAARIVGRPLPGTGAVLLDDPRPAAYCAAGTIVVTAGAVRLLDPAQLAAVLAHERAHLSGRHHAVTLLVRALAAVFPGVPLLCRAPGEVARLLEMAADDAALRRSDRPVLITALVAIATGEPVPGLDPVPRGALAAAAYAVQSRVERLLAPAPGRSRAARYAAALASVALALAVLPPAIVLLA